MSKCFPFILPAYALGIRERKSLGSWAISPAMNPMLWLFRVRGVLSMYLLELSRWQICFIQEFNPVKSRQDGQWT